MHSIATHLDVQVVRFVLRDHLNAQTCTHTHTGTHIVERQCLHVRTHKDKHTTGHTHTHTHEWGRTHIHKHTHTDPLTYEYTSLHLSINTNVSHTHEWYTAVRSISLENTEFSFFRIALSLYPHTSVNTGRLVRFRPGCQMVLAISWHA